MLRKGYALLQSQGLPYLLRMTIRRVFRFHARSYRPYAALFQDRIGLEIGGPSSIFARTGLFPVYPLARRIDNCNFSQRTLWQGEVQTGQTFLYDPQRPAGCQYIAEATDLSVFETASYDFVLSSHTLEHSANPLKALYEWRRVLKPEGVLVLIVPHKDGNFDHRRPVTPLAHLIDDFERGMGEDDLTHLPEILQLHDRRRDPGAGSALSFKARSERNLENRSLHHHVFDTALATAVLNHAGFQIKAVEPLRPYHILTISQSVDGPDNHAFLGPEVAYRHHSPFRSDRAGSRV